MKPLINVTLGPLGPRVSVREDPTEAPYHICDAHNIPKEDADKWVKEKVWEAFFGKEATDGSMEEIS
jgi:hypothetical protein